MWRRACILTSWSLLPMYLLLMLNGSPLGIVYLAAAAAAFAYHLYEERRFAKLDHALAWTCIASNCWLAFNTHDLRATLTGVAAILVAIFCYLAAHMERQHYDRHHTYWHLWCGFAGWMLAQGYVA